MSYRNKTYVIFDGDNDMWAYAYMKGWKKNENVDFNFHDAHDLNTITNLSSEENTKRKLRARLANTKQVIVLIGESTKNLYRFVRWEIDTCQGKGLPIVAVNLNNVRQYDENCCLQFCAMRMPFTFLSMRGSSSTRSMTFAPTSAGTRGREKTGIIKNPSTRAWGYESERFPRLVLFGR